VASRPCVKRSKGGKGRGGGKTGYWCLNSCEGQSHKEEGVGVWEGGGRKNLTQKHETLGETGTSERKETTRRLNHVAKMGRGGNRGGKKVVDISLLSVADSRTIIQKREGKKRGKGRCSVPCRKEGGRGVGHRVNCQDGECGR